MPIRIDNNLPVKKRLEQENIFVMDEKRALSQDIRPLEIAILNLMPLKEDTELELMRSLSNTPLQVDITLIRTLSHESRHTRPEHLERFYSSFEQIRHRKYDGLIITGAPVERMPFEQVEYWHELTQIMDWAADSVTSTLFLCWGAQAGLYYHYGIPKYELPQKLSGIYRQKTLRHSVALTRGFDDEFLAPQSRYTTVRREDIEQTPGLQILAESEETGPYLILGDEGRHIFVTGHPEYDAFTLDREYRRDLARGLAPAVPVHYYPQDDPNQPPERSWRCHATMLYSNWLNYYVYQVTPYVLNENRSPE